MDSTWARVLDFLLEVFPQSKQRQLPSACFAICSSMASSKAGKVDLSSQLRFISQIRFHREYFTKGRGWLMLSHFVHFHSFSGLCDNSTNIARSANCINMLCFNVISHISLVCTFIMAVHTIPWACGWIPAHFTRDQVVQNCKSNRKGFYLFYWCFIDWSLCTRIKCIFREALDEWTRPQRLHE